MKLCYWDHFFKDITEVNFWCLTDMHTNFSIPRTSNTLNNKKAGFQMDSFLNRSSMSAFLEVTAAKKHNSSVLKWSSSEKLRSGYVSSESLSTVSVKLGLGLLRATDKYIKTNKEWC